jgi:MFS family permease
MENIEEKQLFTNNVRVQVIQKDTPTKPVKFVDLLPQLLSSTLMYFPVIHAGVNMSFASVLISQLADGHEIKIDTNQASLIASIWSIALPLGAFSSGFLCDKFGRKKIGLIICVPFSLAWILIGFAKSIEMIYIARIVAGICCGLTTASVVYTAEISYKTFRSSLLCMNSVWVSFGIFSTYLLNYFQLNWHLIGWIYAVMSIVSLLLILIVPESSHWILFFNSNVTDEVKRAQLKKCISWLYRDPEVILILKLSTTCWT